MKLRLPRLGDTFVLRVELRHIEPKIWRRLSVPADVPLDVLHEVIQIAFGWKTRHQHEFSIADIRFAPDDEESELFAVDELGAPLGAVANVGTTFVYRYDFGDGWQHDITVEAVKADGADGFSCSDGARACPPEDCGGPPGYANLLEILADPAHPERPELEKIVGGRFSPEKFDLGSANRKLAALWKRSSEG